MATHGHPNSTLPHPTSHMTARERYSSTTPVFKRSLHQQPRSPTYCGTNLHRHNMSPLSSASLTTVGGTSKRNEGLSSVNSATAALTPPFYDVVTLGTVMADGINIEPDIMCTIDKGFFYAEKNWTCYRRNYFSCMCSFTLTPSPSPAPPNATNIIFCPEKGSSQQYHVYGWAMCISAVVSGDHTLPIELVQHTAKRDKGPTQAPEKIPMAVKPPTRGHHHHVGLYADGNMRPAYPDNYLGGAAPPSTPTTEHSFERIQFKQATQNNGKRRAAQQFYRLIVELWADVGTQAKERYVKVAYRESKDMIVRGRSPGHYSSDRRGSQSNGANSQSLGTYQVVPEYSANAMLLGPASFTATYDGRTHAHAGLRHSEIPTEHALTAEEEKALDSTHRYMYYPDAGLGTSQTDTMQPRNDHDDSAGRMGNGNEHRVKPEYDYSSLPRHFTQTGLSTDRPRCGPFDGKTTSNGYYPNMLSQSGVSFSGVV